jgi:S1-C subfamily serine protease
LALLRFKLNNYNKIKGGIMKRSLKRAGLSILASLVVFITTPFISPSTALALTGSTLTAQELTPDEQNNIEIFKRTNKSVVYVTNSRIRRDYFTLNIQEIPAGTGTGFVWDKSGLIVTNYHVIESASKVDITLWDRSSWKAEIVGIAPSKDLAVLRINAPASLLVPVTPGSASNLSVGRKVLAIGNPFGLDTTLTVGVISALGREIEISGRRIEGLIQTDAAINPGNSGGPLLNSRGELIGVNTLIYSPSGGSSGVGFAIPIDSVLKIVPQLIEHGRIMRPIIGISILDDSITSRYGIKGVIVLDVARDLSASHVGIRGISRDNRGNILLGDIIIKIDELEIKNQADLYLALEKYKPGDEVTVITNRNNRTMKFKVQLSSPQN